MANNLIYLLILLLYLTKSSSSSSLTSLVNTSSNHLHHHVGFSTKPTLKTYNVIRHFGAKNDGRTDATKAFLNAWNAACVSRIPSQIYVPRGRYILSHIYFKGLCKSYIVFRINGTLIISNKEYYTSEFSWIVFHNIHGLHIKGGVLDAKGKYLWDCKSTHQRCPKGTTSMSFDNSKNIIVDGLKSINSQWYHITINACQNMNFGGVTLIAPAVSPNTDGIHMERSYDITIKHSKFMTGDDCISIGPNNQNIWIEHVFCGPGHGISIGSLGRESDKGVVVKNVTVKAATFRGTTNGFRIKTFSTPVYGTVKDIYFIGATMIDVRNPIIIDQNYLAQGYSSKGSGIQINNVWYKSIHGSSSTQKIVTFDCSKIKPCYDLRLQDIRLYFPKFTPKCECKNCYFKLGSYMQPSHCYGIW